MTPWTDRAGRFSPLKTLVLVGALAPAVVLLANAWMANLGPRPYTAAIHFTGDWAMRFLLITLCVTPFRHVFQSTKLVATRRLLGLAALGYALLHVALYVADLKYDLAKVASEIVLRVYLTIGFTAVVMMVVLGATSFDGVIKRMGAERWRRLHLLTYPTTILGLLHFYIQSRLDVTEPVLFTGILLVLFGTRFLLKRRIALSLWSLGAVALIAALLTAATEIAWYALVRNVPWDVLVMAQLDFEATIRPAWWVLTLGVSLAVASLIAPRLTGGAPGPRRRSPEGEARPRTA